MTAPFVYKIVDANTWNAAASAGVFTGAGIDLTDGFIHLSSAEQVSGTANLFFRGVKERLVVLEVDTTKLEDPSRLKFEEADGKRFPHLYSTLACSAVSRVIDLIPEADGMYHFTP